MSDSNLPKLSYKDIESTPLVFQLLVKSISFVITTIFHIRYIWPYRKNLKLGLFRLLDTYLIIMFLRATFVFVIILIEFLMDSDKEYLWWEPVQMIIY